MSTLWEQVGDKYRCLRHGVIFGALESCSQCVSTASSLSVYDLADEDDEGIPAPDGCATTEQHEREFTSLAAFAETQARKVAEGYGKARGRVRPNPMGAMKILDTAIKARRAASALARAREDDALVMRLERRRQALQRGRH